MTTTRGTLIIRLLAMLSLPRRPIHHLVLALVLALATCGGVAPRDASAETQQTTVAQTRMAQLPADDLLIRFIDLTVPAGQTAVTHMHSAGYAYAVEGTHVLALSGREVRLAPGRAAWIELQEQHTHGAVASASSRFLFMLAAATSNRGAAPLWPYPTAKIGGETADFRAPAPGPHDIILSEVRLTRPGDTIGALGQRGPAGVLVLDGQVSLDGRPLAAEGAVLQQPGASGTFTNTGTGAARLVVLEVVPSGQAPGLPATGAGGLAAAPALPWLALLAGGGLMAGLGSAWRRRRRA